jgi:DNA-binding Xre family transcriptional regulator
MAKIKDASKLLSGCMDPLRAGGQILRMANIRKGGRQRQQFRRTYIRQWREHRGLTLERLADRVGMTAGNLSQLERGNQGYTQNTLENLAHALQTDVASLLMRDPSDSEGLWSIWDQAQPGERKMLVDIAKTVIKTGTDE